MASVCGKDEISDMQEYVSPNSPHCCTLSFPTLLDAACERLRSGDWE